MPRKGFSGALARVRILDECLDQPALRRAAGFDTAYAPSPAPRAVTDSLRVTLAWTPGADDVLRSVVHLGTNRADVARGDDRLRVADARARDAGPVDLVLGAT